MSTSPTDDPVVRSLAPLELLQRIEDGDERFIVTGATGWFGTATLHILDAALGDASVRRLRAFAASGRRIELRSGRSLDVLPLTELPRLAPSDGRQCVLHFAYLMRHLALELGTEEFVRRNREITSITAGAIERLAPSSFCFASSGAVYDGAGGYVDDLEHDPYATLKRADEVRFEEECRAAGTRCVIGRVYSVGGPFMPDRDRFVLGDLVDRARAGVPLVIRARRELWRSYVGLGDLVALFLAEALDGNEPFVRFDTGGTVVEASELADAVRRVLDRPDLGIERVLDPASEPDRYVGDGATFERLMAGHGLTPTPLDEQIRQVALA